ncbi:MAG: hypothetical protein K6D02_01805 [Lachnospiraceae bacterium]|nr:hypothetical protein [Lachnospiraceae bacterium]
MIPKYIANKIKKQHDLLYKAEELSYEIIEWYDKKIDNTLNIDEEEYNEITFDGVPFISKEAIINNLELEKQYK